MGKTNKFNLLEIDRLKIVGQRRQNVSLIGAFGERVPEPGGYQESLCKEGVAIYRTT